MRIETVHEYGVGAGTTIMAGLPARDLKLRGFAERFLVVRPTNPTFHLRRKFSERFLRELPHAQVLGRCRPSQTFSVNR